MSELIQPRIRIANLQKSDPVPELHTCNFGTLHLLFQSCMYATPERGVAYMQLWNITFIVPELHVCNSGTRSCIHATLEQ